VSICRNRKGEEKELVEGLFRGGTPFLLLSTKERPSSSTKTLQEGGVGKCVRKGQKKRTPSHRKKSLLCYLYTENERIVRKGGKRKGWKGKRKGGEARKGEAMSLPRETFSSY